MFSEACLSHSVYRECLCIMSFPVWLSGPMFFLGGPLPGPMFLAGGYMSKGVSGDGVSVWGRGSLSGDGGISFWPGSLSRRGLCPERSVYEGNLSIETAAESEMRAIDILVECFLVLF